MLSAAVTLALLGLVLSMVVRTVQHEGRKIIAALEGRSWVAEPEYDYPVTVRFSSRCTAVEPAPTLRPVLRAAA